MDATLARSTDSQLFADIDTTQKSAATAKTGKTAVQTDKQVAPAAPATIAYEAPIRNAKNHIVKVESNYGEMVLELYHDLAPIHADSFLARVKDGFYVNTIFHRVIKGFMIQGGDPTGTGMGDAKYRLKAEFSQEPHKRGTLSMARSADPNSASCQFFVCHADSPFLNGQYTVFGHLLSGYATLDKIAATKVAGPQGSTPVEQIFIKKTTVVK